MKKSIFIIFFIILNFQIYAKEVTLNQARKVALNFIKTRTNSNILTEYYFHLKNIETSSPIPTGISKFIYTFNIEGGGFILISADDRVEPVLGYSLENSIETEKLPNNISNWYSWYYEQIKFIIEQNIPASQKTTELWNQYLNTSSNLNSRGSQTVNPLIQTKWDQSPYYNTLCPGGSVVGCVATAMAQIMKYNAYPPQGQGSKSYNHPNYGTISANFGTATYNYSDMPNSISSSNSEIAKLSFHCGVSVEMNYTPQESGAAGATIVAPAFQNYFGYPTATIEDRNTKSTEEWKTILKKELDASRPMYYEGLGGGSGHAFVCDGYDDNDFFHFNWGWSGTANGFYNINNLVPTATGTGAGLGNYNSDQKIVRNIAAPIVVNPAKLEMSENINLSSSSISYGGSLTAETNIVNNGTGNFQGDLGFVILDDSFNFIDTFGVYSNVTLNSGNTFQNPIPFSFSNRFSLLPGNYLMALCFRLLGKDWTIVSKTNTYGNAANFSIVYSNGIELATSYPANILKMEIESTPTIPLKFKNDYTSNLDGVYSLAMYTLDGDFVQTLDTILDPNPLLVGATHSTPLNFTSKPITALPGTYLLASIFQQTGSSNSSLVGSTYNKNPIKVIITDKPLSPDEYEVNNTFAQSKDLPLNLIGNTATILTNNSNIHNSDDLDYYKVTLPADGSMYNFSARLHDKDNSTNGKTYSLDAAFTYSMDGTTWANGINTSMSSPVNINSGKTLYFLVGPKFAGTLGTYQFDINITKGSSSIINNDKWNLNLYPNPCSNFIKLESNSPFEKNAKALIYDIYGRNILSIEIPKGTDQFLIDLSKINSGNYFVKISSNLYEQTLPFIKQ